MDVQVKEVHGKPRLHVSVHVERVMQPWCTFLIYMLFTGREVRMGKNCARGLEYGPRPKAEGRTQDQGHSFFPYGPT